MTAKQDITKFQDLLNYKSFLVEAKLRTLSGDFVDNWFTSNLIYYEKIELLNTIDKLGRDTIIPILDKEIDLVNNIIKII